MRDQAQLCHHVASNSGRYKQQSYSAQPQTTLQEKQRGFCDGLQLQSKPKPPSERQFERHVKPNTTYQPTYTSDTVVCRLCPSPTTALRAFSQTYISTKRYRRHPLPISVAAKRVSQVQQGGHLGQKEGCHVIINVFRNKQRAMVTEALLSNVKQCSTRLASAVGSQ